MHYFLDISLNISAIYLLFWDPNSTHKDDSNSVWYAIYCYIKTLLKSNFISESIEAFFIGSLWLQWLVGRWDTALLSPPPDPTTLAAIGRWFICYFRRPMHFLYVKKVSSFDKWRCFPSSQNTYLSQYIFKMRNNLFFSEIAYLLLKVPTQIYTILPCFCSLPLSEELKNK